MKKILLPTLISLIFLTPSIAQAGSLEEFFLSKKTVNNGYTISYDEENLKLSIWPKAFDDAVNFKISKEKYIKNPPKGYRLLSQAYKIRCSSDECGKLDKDLTFTVKYQNPGFNNKWIMWYDKRSGSWQKLNTHIDEPGLSAVADLKRKNIRQVAVFEKLLLPKRHRLASSALSSDKKIKLGTQFHLKMEPATFSRQVDIRIKQVNQNNYPDLPDEDILSNLFHYKVIDNKKPDKPITFKIRSKKYTENPVKIKKYNKKNGWQSLDTSYNSNKMLARTQYSGKKGIFGLFESKEFQIGGASWYNWDGAASNDYPMGTELKVTNLANGKSCDTTVVSTGPFTPGLIIDLPLEKFNEIANPNTGIIQVRVEKK